MIANTTGERKREPVEVVRYQTLHSLIAMQKKSQISVSARFSRNPFPSVIMFLAILLKQPLGKLADHSITLTFDYFTLISNGSCYSVVLLLLFSDHNYYNNYNEFTRHAPFKGVNHMIHQITVKLSITLT